MKAFLVSMFLFAAVTSRGAVIYFDDFQQFPNGTTLTQTNYVPVIGDSAQIQTNDNGDAATTVVSSNLLGSTRAFFQLGNPPYQHGYRGDATTGALTNQPVVLSFKLWVQQTKNVNSIGGMGINITTTNIDFIDQNGTNLSNNPLIFINDGGQVFVFTNNPAPPAHLNNVQIGSWGTLAGQFMNNTLTLDYPAGTYSFSINGTVLTNAAIPAFITNLFDRVRLDLFEGISGAGTLNSQGNRFAIDDVQVIAGPALTNQDVRTYVAAAKGQIFEQATAGSPVMSTTGFSFQASVDATVSNSVLSATDQVPGGAIKTLVKESPDSPSFDFKELFTTKPALDGVYSNGTYTLTILTVDQGQLSPALNLPTDAYPTTPQLLNFAAAQGIGSSTNFTVVWNAFAGGTTNDLISFDVRDAGGNDVLGTPDFDDPSHLNGTATSFVIPGGTLQSGLTYTGTILFAKVTARDSNTVAGALGITAYLKRTSFPIATVASVGLACSLTPALATNNVTTLHTVTATITSNNAPAVGLLVDFSVISGPGIGNSGTGTTDGNGQAAFSYTSIVVGTDTIQAASISTTCTATEVWLLPNIAPVANCHNVTTNAGANCTANVPATAVDNGSTDADGIIVLRALTPAGPYALGVTPVTLTVTDDRGATNSCSATITINDTTPPLITCAGNIVTNVPNGTTNAVVSFGAPTATDNCGVASTNSTPPSGSTFGLGTNTVTSTAVDNSGNTNTCSFTIIVNELPPEADLGIVKIATPSPALLGLDLTYTITVTNRGPNATTGVTVTDPLPAGVTFVSALTSQGSSTQVTGTVTANLGTLASGAGATLTIVVTPTVVTQVCNTATVTGTLNDSVTNNNSSTVCVGVEVHDLAVTALKPAKTITLTATKTNETKFVKVTIQNRSAHSETITNLNGLVTLVAESLSNVCPNATVTLHVGKPQKTLPIVLKTKKKLNVVFDVVYNCANDPAKGAGHEDFKYTATVHHEAIDGKADTHSADDACPHAALPGGVDPNPDGKIKDKGCGGKNSDGTLGAAVKTDVVVK